MRRILQVVNLSLFQYYGLWKKKKNDYADGSGSEVRVILLMFHYCGGTLSSVI